MIYRWQSLTLLSLVFYLIFPIPFDLQSVGISQVLAQNSNPRKAEADKLIKQGYELDDNNQPQAALQAFQTALSIYQEIKDKHGESKALNFIGIIYSDDFDEYNQAITYYQQALEIARKINDNTLEAKALNNLGLANFRLGNSQHAIEYCKQGLAVAQRNKNYETEAIVLKSLAAIYFGTDTDKELNFLGQSLTVLEKASGNAEDKLRQNKLKFSILIHMGNIYYFLCGAKKQADDSERKELLDKSLKYYQNGLKIAQEVGDRPKQGKALLSLGDLYHLNSQYTKSSEIVQQESAKAIESFQQAIKIFTTNKNFRSQARLAYMKLGDVYYRWSKKEEALKAYQEALNIIKIEVPISPYNKLEQDVQQGLILISIGNIYANTSQYEQALVTYKPALETLNLALREAKKISTPAKQIQILIIQLKIEEIYGQLCIVYKFMGQYEASKKACQDSINFDINFPLTKYLSNKSKLLNKAAKSPAYVKEVQKLQDAVESLQQSQASRSPAFIRLIRKL
ncbi:TPR repeat-containing protein (plasmid) [Nostoc sp. HK-01]|nr:TPR repeat-containing protein [Nostoc sp. HK-01]